MISRSFALQRLTCIALVIALLGALSACQTGNSRELLAQAKALESIKVAEPALIGKVIDFETRQPLQGVSVYGFYATTRGSVGGGSSINEPIRSFETQSDANGEFKLPAWDSGEQRYSEAPFGTKMPRLAFFKGGYGVDMRGYQSIRQYRPSTKTQEDWKGETTPQIAADGTIDWRATPHALKRTITELERYNALVDSGDAMLVVGPCGWETYAGLISAQHIEVINTKRRLIPADRRTTDDMPKDAYPLGVSNRTPEATAIENMLIRQAPLHRLRDSFISAGGTWKCRNPEDLLRAVESQLIGK
jgi:hypothetical protein